MPRKKSRIRKGSRNHKPSYLATIAGKIREEGLHWPFSFSEKWKYLLLFAAVMSVFLYFYYSLFFTSNLLLAITNVQARIVGEVLGWFGMAVNVSGNTLHGSSSSISVMKGCDGMEPIVMFIVGVLVTPLKWKKKIPGLLAGIAVLFILNLIRIAVLYLSSLYFPSLFDFLHIHGGYIIFIGITIIIWLIWLNWAMKPETAKASSNR